MIGWIYRLIDWQRCGRKFDGHNFAGAGNVNWWSQSDARRETRKLAVAGLPCYHIELFGWGGTHGYDRVDEVLRKVDAVLFWCRRRRLALFVSVCNDNIHLSKYGNKPLDIGNHTAEITRALRHLAAAARKQAVLVQPVGETQTSSGRRIEALAREIVPMQYLVANTGSRPRAVPGWAAYAAYHAARVGDAVPRGLWDVTDHGNLLNQLGGVNAQSYNDDMVEADASRARAARNPYVLYMFQQRAMDTGNLRAVAKGYYGGQ